MILLNTQSLTYLYLTVRCDYRTSTSELELETTKTTAQVCVCVCLRGGGGAKSGGGVPIDLGSQGPKDFRLVARSNTKILEWINMHFSRTTSF